MQFEVISCKIIRLTIPVAQPGKRRLEDTT